MSPCLPFPSSCPRAQAQGAAAGRVLLGRVMGLADGRVIARQGGRGRGREMEEKVHARAHVGRDQERGAGAGVLELGPLRLGEARGPDHRGLAQLRGAADGHHAGLRGAEIDEEVGLLQELRQAVEARAGKALDGFEADAGRDLEARILGGGG